MITLPPIEVLCKYDVELCEQIFREHRYAVPMGDSLVCKVLGRYLLYVDPHDVSMAPHLAHCGFWELWHTRAVAQHVPRGGRYIDVGAAYGYYTLLLADLAGAQGSVLAFEPNKVQADRIRRSCSVNGVKLNSADPPPPARPMGILTIDPHIPVPRTITLKEEAVSDHLDAKQGFMRDNRHVGGSTLRIPEHLEEHQHLVRVPTVTLDVQLDLDPTPFDFVKIDAEGFEAQVWRGMKRMRQHPAIQIFMELTASAHADGGKAMLEEAVAEGFRLHEVTDNGDLQPRSIAQLLEVRPDVMVWFKR